MVSSNQDSKEDSVASYYLKEAESARPDGKFVSSSTKLKIVESNKRFHEEEEVVESAPGPAPAPQAPKEHYCADCDKSFSSGKALGGHMSSAHVQAGKDYQSKKMRMKKLKKRGGSDLDEFKAAVDADAGGETKVIICDICDKVFRSRKSLYGHMRCHPERVYRGMHPPPPLESCSAQPESSSFAEKKIQTSSSQLSYREEDDRAFSLLYDYNDENDDQNDDVNVLEKFYSDSTHRVRVKSESSPVIDLTKFLSRNWTVTGRRGRPGRNRSGLDDASSSWDDETISTEEAEELGQAAYSLVNLGNSLVKSEETDQDINIKKRRKAQDLDFSSKSNRQRVEDSCPPAVRGKLVIGEKKSKPKANEIVQYKGKGKAPLIESNFDEDEDSYSNNSFFDDDYDSERTPDQYPNQRFLDEFRRKPNSVVLKEKEKEKETDLTPEKYKCSTCKKTFATHQALGGHRSSHNKLRVSIQNPIDDDDDDFSNSSPPPDDEKEYSNLIAISSQSLLEKDGSGSKSAGENNNCHRCQICYKTFSSGQALGGHMRCHASASASAGPSASASTSPPPQGGANIMRYNSMQKVLNFDLNQLPPQVDDQDGKSGGD
ncbi:hypothetical protein M9H77_13831 [Catharanthus roseus]|uniref:Uncharacterized protein n=1 Tax=Catharanthus roseus TaxID=4058 RepID=A0ACC0BLK0_CATRO|nr:hypothetical protein M9H77_13831 [Catharanthus roseus]